MSALMGDVIAAAADMSDVNVGVLAQYGVLGVFAMLLVWFARGAHQRERDRADRLEDETRRLNEAIQERVIPALTSATRAVEESVDLLNAVQREREARRIVEQELRGLKGVTDQP